MNAKNTQTFDAIECLLSDARGQYIPRDFIANFDITQWGIDPNSWEANTCAAGPDAPDYWDAWRCILDKAEFKEGPHTWTLHQDGDLWAMCYELMTDEEKRNFDFDFEF